MNDYFSFGKVKGKEMIDILNMPKINGNFSGLQYLVGMHDMTSQQFIKNEIIECLKKYSGNYILKFGKYSNMTLKQIDVNDRSYVDKYLVNNDNKEIRIVVDNYIKYFRSNDSKVYNQYQQEIFNRNAYLIEEINSRPESDIRRVIRYMSFEIDDKNYFSHCPWGCEERTSYFEHSKLKKGKECTYLIYCFKCGESKNFIEFVQGQKHFTKPEALIWIAGILEIVITYNNCDVDINRNKYIEIHNNEIELEKKKLDEVNLEEYGFKEGVYPTYFYKRGFTADDADKMEVYFAGKNCRNIFRNRVCFVVRDLDQRIVGIVGRNKYSEQEYFDYWIKRNEIDLSLSREEQIFLVKKHGNKYKKYYNNEGFKKGNVLYGENTLSSEYEYIIIVEGPFDVLRMKTNYDYKNTASFLGKQFSSGQVYKLYNLYKEKRDSIKIYLFVDNDVPALEAFEKNVKTLQEVGFTNVYKMILEGANDAAEATKEQVDKAYINAELQPVRYAKKKIVINDIDAGSKYLDEE